jgi:hypothetical protein
LWNILAKQGTSGPLFMGIFHDVLGGVVPTARALRGITSPGELTWLGILAAVMSGALHAGIFAVAARRLWSRGALGRVPGGPWHRPCALGHRRHILLGEPFTYAIAAGTALVVIGIFVIGVVGRPPEGPIWRGVWRRALTAIFIASYTIDDGGAVQLLSVFAIIIDYFGNIVRVLMLSPVALCRRAELPEHWRKSCKVIWEWGC